MTLAFVSLFSGIGGFDLAFERAGMQCVTQVEIDKNCLGVLAHHWPNVKRYEDVRNVGRNELGTIDLICGGFPCQDLSVAGRRAGLVGERSGLWFEFHRIIADTRPRWVVIENVPGLLSSNGGKDFAVILRGLVECGYGVCWRILDAQYFGLAQRRRRVFIVASLGSGRCAQVLFEREGVCGDTPPGRKEGARIARAISACPTATGRLDPNGQDFVVGSLNAHSKEHGYAMTTQQAAENGQLVVNAFSGYTGGADDNDAQAWHVIPVLQQRMGTGGNQVPLVGIRRLTPTECERLQGFPDGWTGRQSDSVRYRQLGNAVAVPVVEWIGKRISMQENHSSGGI